MKMKIFKGNRFSVHLPGKWLTFLFAIALTTASPAVAQMDWNGSNSTSWINGGNWTPAGPPGMNDDVVIDTVNPNDTVINGWNVTARQIDIGSSNTGRLAILNNGTLDTGPVLAVIGRSAGAEGTVTVNGMGSNWTTSGLQVGRTGTGTLSIEAGGSVNNSAAWVGHLFGTGDGTVTVTGTGSAWDNASVLRVAQTGLGRVRIEDGATLSSTDGIIGVTTGEGEVTVTGAGSAWNYAGELSVGQGSGNGGASGTLTIADGGQVVNAGIENAWIGEEAGAEGWVTVTGSGSGWDTGGSLRVGNNGSGTLNIGEDATVSVGEDVSVADQPESEGTLLVNGVLAAVDGTTINTGGRLGGAGAVGGGATTIAGTVAPGDPVGTLLTRELILEDTAVLEFELDEPGGTNDSMFANGDLTLDGVLHVSDLGDFGPGSYLLIQYSDTLNDNGLMIGSLPSGFGASVDTTTAGEVRLVVEALPDEVFSDRFETAGP